MTAGRKRARQPATAYDYQRIEALVDVLAMDEPAARKGLKQLCEDWGVNWETDYARYAITMDVPATLRALARLALEYIRTQPEILTESAGDAVHEYLEDM